MISARRVAVVSDLHLGRPDAPHACNVKLDEVKAAASVLAETHDLAVVNGDLFDLERGTWPLQGREYELLSQVHAEAAAALRAPPWIWTRGNHDRVLEALELATEHVEVALPCGVVRIEHGDRFNAFIKRWPPFTTFVTWVSGRVEAVPALRPIYRAMRFADLALTGTSRASEDPVVTAAAEWLGTRPDLRALVIGHPHEAVLRGLSDGRTVMNPGGSTEQIHALSLDGEQCLARLLRWQDGCFVEVEARPF